jgi:hypothetical protein
MLGGAHTTLLSQVSSPVINIVIVEQRATVGDITNVLKRSFVRSVIKVVSGRERERTIFHPALAWVSYFNLIYVMAEEGFL